MRTIKIHEVRECVGDVDDDDIPIYTFISVSSHERHGDVWNQQLVHQLVQTLCEGIHQWRVEPLHESPLPRKTFPCQDVIMYAGATYDRLAVGSSWKPRWIEREYFLNHL